MNTTAHTRRLPFDVRPFHRETLENYSQRLLAANFCDSSHRTHLTRQMQVGKGADAARAAWMRVLTTQTNRSQVHLHADSHGWLKDDHLGCNHFTKMLPPRFGCTLCAHGDHIEQNPHFDTIVCTRHHRWLGLWGRPESQHRVDRHTVAAQRRFAKLRRSNRIDPRIYLYVIKSMAQALHPGIPIEEAEPRVFAAAIRTIAALTTDEFARRVFDPATPYSETHAYLAGTVSEAIRQNCPALVRDLWIYLRPTVLALRDAIHMEHPYKQPGWHHYPLRQHLGDSLAAFRGDLQPEAAYLDVTADTPLTAVTRTAELSRLNYGAIMSEPSSFTCTNGHTFEYLPPDVPPLTMTPTLFVPECGRCTDRRVRTGENDIETKFPDIAAQFDVFRNGGLTAADVAHSSRTEHWWLCPYGHSHKASPYKKTTGLSRCSVCSTREVRPGINCLLTTHPEHAARWADEWTDAKSPSALSAGANELSSWRCDNEHVFTARPWEITTGKVKCNLCGRERKVSYEKSLEVTHPEQAALWHPFLNGKLTPALVTHGERREVWWQCAHGHDFRGRLDKVTAGAQCNVCTSRRFSAGDNDLETLEPVLSLEFDTERNGKTAEETFASDHSFWWLCLKGKHHHAQTTQNRRNSRGCPKCPPEERILNYWWESSLAA